MEERTDELNTPASQDSGDTEYPGGGTEEAEDKTSTEGTPEGEHAEGREDETSVDWKKRYQDIQTELTKLQQWKVGMEKEKTGRMTQEEARKFEEESKKRLDVGTYLEQFKENPHQGLNEWASAREQSTMQSVYSTIGPIASQTQLTQWRLMKILQEIAPEVMEKHLEKEKAMKKVLGDVPALYNFPNYLDQAEKMALSNVSQKDLKQLEQKLEKDVRKSIEQQTGKSIPASKAPLKEKKELTKEEAWKERAIELGKRSTKLT